MNRTLLLLFAVPTTFLLALPAQSEKMPKQDVIEIPAIGKGLWVSNAFQANMVLQRDKPINVWGWATPGEEVTVSLAGNSATATAAKDREWRVSLPARPANSKPQAMIIRGQVKSKTVTLGNILIGDVWILGGQSNMEHELAKVENGNLEVASANFPEIRILTIPQGELNEPVAGFSRLHEWIGFFNRHFRKGDWDACTPEIAKDLSAIGYVFARRIHKASKVPIGVIDMSRGGTSVESWTPLETLRQMDQPWTNAVLADWDKKAQVFEPKADLKDRIKKNRAWVARMTKEGRAFPEDRKSDPTDLRIGPIGDMNHPGANYAGMLKTIEGLSVKGAIWHQGYNNAIARQLNGPDMYREVFPVMIASWRKAFNAPDMPFGILSLCTDGTPQTLDNYSEMMLNFGIEVREVQYKVFTDLYNAGDKNIGFVSTHDLSRNWYHPNLKLPVGERAARWAMVTQYGFSDRLIAWKPPVITAMKVQKDSLVLSFDMNVKNPEDRAIHGFAIAGEDRKFHPATAASPEIRRDARNRPQYDRKSLELTSAMVPNPVHYRYAWGRNPLVNLQGDGNKDLPLATQRSDDWPATTVPLGILPEDATLPIERGAQRKLTEALRKQDKQRRLREAELKIVELGRK